MIPEEAALVGKIFAGYLKTHSPVAVADQLDVDGRTTKLWSTKAGHLRGGRRLTSKYIHRVLTNQVYLGRITHREAGQTRSWQGLHDAIIEQETWDQVQELMSGKGTKSRYRWTLPYLLKGKLRTGDGFAMSPGSVHRPGKVKGQKRLVRYYVSQKAIKHGYGNCTVKTMNAGHLDELVRALALGYLASDSVAQLAQQQRAVRDHWIREIIDVVELSAEKLVIRLDLAKIAECRENEWEDSQSSELERVPTCPYKPKVEIRRRHAVITLSIQIKRLDGRRIILSPEGRDLVLPAEPEPREHIVNAIGLAYRWYEELLSSGCTIANLAQRVGVSGSRIRKLLPLTHLGPDVLKAALKGYLPPSITLDDMHETAKDLEWAKQSKSLGLDALPSPITSESTDNSSPTLTIPAKSSE